MKPHNGRLKRLAGNILILSISFILALFLGEILARIVFHESMDFDMEMWKYANRIKIISDNPEAGFEHRPDSTAHLMGVDVATNRFGLRSNEIELEKPANTYRIVVIGDSVTFGWGVPQDQTYSAQLERILNTEPPAGFPQDVQFEVLNLGVGNYNTAQEIARLQDIGLQFDPDLILLGYFINDAELTPQPNTNFLIENSYLFAFLLSRLRILSFGNAETLTYVDYYRGLYEDQQPGWGKTKASLADLVDIGQDQNIPVVMFIIPELHNLSESYPFKEIHKELTLIGTESELPVVDLFPIFHNYTPEEALWVSPTDAHHNIEAQSMIADGILNALQPDKTPILDLTVFEQDSSILSP